MVENLKTKSLISANDLDPFWNQLCDSTYQKIAFLKHIEQYNYCNQRYYQAYKNDRLIAGAVIYSLRVNVLTFAKYNLTLPMTIIGIPASVDAKGIIGNSDFCSAFINEIMKQEKGIILCLNYNDPLGVNKIIEMQTLPSMIYNNNYPNWEAYINSLRHNYRRRILKAQAKFNDVRKVFEPCSKFTRTHYQLYLNVVKKSKTKLEILKYEFFINLPSEYQLFSFYHESELLTWHITTLSKNVYYFVFGGVNYTLRDTFDSYYNNLIHILIEGNKQECNTINFGQTAEVSKNRLGATPQIKRMFIYHKNPLIRLIFRLSKNFLSYDLKTRMIEVQKTKI